MAGYAELLVIEGAAGTGKTATLAAARHELAAWGNELVVVTPTLKAAHVAAHQTGGRAFSAAWLAHQYGFRWDENGAWSRVPHSPHQDARLDYDDVLLIDEAGMLDQDTALALITIADETGANLTMVGDRHQLPAVGRGGVLDLAARWAHPEALLTLDSVHRFTDPKYAALSLLMRTGERRGEVFDTLLGTGRIAIHASEVECQQALATEWLTEGDPPLLVANTREQVAALNALVHDLLVDAGRVDDTTSLTTRAGQRMGIGDQVATRENDRGLGVANRDTWIIESLTEDGGATVTGVRGRRSLPRDYVQLHLELAYATTAHGAQGDTVASAHLLVGDDTGAAAAYVGMTRGRQRNVAHLVADSTDNARRQWIDVFNRDRADLGPTHAAATALDDIDRYGPASRAEVTLQRAALQRALQPASSPRSGSTTPYQTSNSREVGSSVSR
ncbi:MAG TPA: AAA family ATPase [Nocardioides sp.]|uniref:ATP-dependent DNA helicase n=1 Tax=Nocardioides sp. TaxID=35761 RepID=UPI002E381C74|nr:AAA family ATPase [Nocardioides sp.]HEX5089626.1 AAA family ATPase [Nocardioides sp.]